MGVTTNNNIDESIEKQSRAVFRSAPVSRVSLSDFVCSRSEDNQIKTNIMQTVWFDASIDMEWATENETAKHHLSANILSYFLPGSDYEAAIGAISQTNHKLYRFFTEEVIDTMPPEGGRIPVDQVQQWIYRNIQAYEVLQDPTASYWLKQAFSSVLTRDPVDAVNDAKTLVSLLENRLEMT